jgi:hypothetical protein
MSITSPLGTGLAAGTAPAERLDGFTPTPASAPSVGAGADPLQHSGTRVRDSPEPAIPEALPAMTVWRVPTLAGGAALGPRGGYGIPGRSAMSIYQQRGAGEMAAWARTVRWRAAAMVAAGMAGGILAQVAGLDHQGLLVELAAGGGVGWWLRFRASPATGAWRDGAKGARATARLLRRLHRRGYVCFHDIAIPGMPATADHLLVGPSGVILVNSRRYTGRMTQTADGRVWRNYYPIDDVLHSLRIQTAAISRALGVPVHPVMCVHRAKIARTGLRAGGVQIFPARRVRSMLRGGGQCLNEADVAALVVHILTVLRPAG